MPRLTLLLCLCLGACAGAPPRHQAAPAPQYAEPTAWHACRAGIAWTEGAAPDWSVDVLLAHAVFAPVLADEAAQISAWRFHRRAARDQAGHRFSFLFRAAGPDSLRIAEAARRSVALQWALHDGLIVDFDCRDLGYWSGTELSATSDPAWSPQMRQAWPHFIQGVSRFWLALIENEMAGLPPDADLVALQRASRAAHQRVSEIWSYEAPHALLHHLNAIFAYQPWLMRF